MIRVSGRVAMPASSAPYPSTVWRSMTRKNMIAPSAAYTSRVIALAALKLREANMSSGIIGCRVRCSTTRKATPATSPTPKAARAYVVRHSISQ